MILKHENNIYLVLEKYAKKASINDFGCSEIWTIIKGNKRLEYFLWSDGDSAINRCETEVDERYERIL